MRGERKKEKKSRITLHACIAKPCTLLVMGMTFVNTVEVYRYAIPVAIVFTIATLLQAVIFTRNFAVDSLIT